MALPVMIKHILEHDKTAPDERNGPATFAYIYDSKGEDKVLLTGSLNMLADDDDHKGLQHEMLSKHAKYKGRGKPLRHIVISYEKGLGEKLEKKDFEKDIQTLLKHYGMGNHSAVFSVHGNTKNIHAHVLLDRLAPDKKNGKYYVPLENATVTSMSDSGKKHRNDVLCQHAAISEICEYRGYDASSSNIKTDKHGKPNLNAKDVLPTLPRWVSGIEKRTNTTHPVRILQATAEEIFSNAKSQKELDRALANQGLIYEKFEKGHRIRNLETNEFITNSYLSKNNSFTNLQARFNKKPTTIDKKAYKNELFHILDYASKKFTNYEQLEKSLEDKGYSLVPSGGSYKITKDGFEFKLSEVARKFSKVNFENYFASNDTERKAEESRIVHAERMLRNLYKQKENAFILRRIAFFEGIIQKNNDFYDNTFNVMWAVIKHREFGSWKEYFQQKAIVKSIAEDLERSKNARKEKCLDFHFTPYIIKEIKEIFGIRITPTISLDFLAKMERVSVTDEQKSYLKMLKLELSFEFPELKAKSIKEEILSKPQEEVLPPLKPKTLEESDAELESSRMEQQILGELVVKSENELSESDLTFIQKFHPSFVPLTQVEADAKRQEEHEEYYMFKSSNKVSKVIQKPKTLEESDAELESSRMEQQILGELTIKSENELSIDDIAFIHKFHPDFVPLTQVEADAKRQKEHEEYYMFNTSNKIHALTQEEEQNIKLFHNSNNILTHGVIQNARQSQTY